MAKSSVELSKWHGQWSLGPKGPKDPKGYDMESHENPKACNNKSKNNNQLRLKQLINPLEFGG